MTIEEQFAAHAKEDAVAFATIMNTLHGQNDTLARIEGQTTKTNGRVDSLEAYRNQTEKPLIQLFRDREDKFKKYGDLAWKITFVVVAIVLGIDKIKGIL